MKIVLIQCPSWLTESPPYNLALLSAILKKRGHQPVCFDLNIELYNYCKESPEADSWLNDERANCWHDENYVLSFIQKNESYIENFIFKVLDVGSSVIGFTVYSLSQFFSYELAKKIKEKDPNKMIIFGGPQCFRNGEGIRMLERPGVDTICFGEGDDALPDLLDIIEQEGEIGFCKGFGYRDKDGKIIDCGDAPLIENLYSLPFADFSDFDIEKYTRKILPIATTRGCIYRCTFCSESHHWKRFRCRSSSNIYNELMHQIKNYPIIRDFWFNDSLVNGDIKILNELSDLIIKNKIQIKWYGQAAIRKEMTKDFLDKLKQAGCITLLYGVESGSDKILRLMKKNFSVDLAEEVIRNTYEVGISLNFNIIVGFPRETDIEFQGTLDFLKRNARYADRVAVNLLHVQNGAELARDKNIWGIQPTFDLDTFWYMSDEENNYEVRLRRLNLCREIVQGRTFVTTDETDINLRLGDSFFRKNNFKIALDYYLRAKGSNRDLNKAKIIEKKLDQIKNSIPNR